MIQKHIFAIVFLFQLGLVDSKAHDLVFEIGFLRLQNKIETKELNSEDQEVAHVDIQKTQKLYYNIHYRVSNKNFDIELAKYNNSQSLEGENFQDLPALPSNNQWNFMIEIYKDGRLKETYKFDNDVRLNSTVHNPNRGIYITKRLISFKDVQLDDINDLEIQTDQPFNYGSTIRVFIGLKYREEEQNKIFV